ncbi:hypothetical protein DFS33DRAFT_1387444 [Desarmillaria ectypa]|nr:hypothetical protein DFS33DRAFT_1387444 [Desarmillaria ectypa]
MPVQVFSHNLGQRLAFWTSIETNRNTRYIQGTIAPKSKNTIIWKIYLTHELTSNGTLGITSDAGIAGSDV